MDSEIPSCCLFRRSILCPPIVSGLDIASRRSGDGYPVHLAVRGDIVLGTELAIEPLKRLLVAALPGVDPI